MKRTAPAKTAPNTLTPMAARKVAGLSREDLASKAEVSYSTVCRVEQSGEWPKQPKPRARYLAALNLTEETVAEVANV
jgi:ribosome-binding protein aMBF1 (putative translation factor)